MKTLDEAIVFAINAHKGQFRKHSGLPYIVHPLEVMICAKNRDMSTEALIAAVLHDVVEDCGVNIETIREFFGQEVADIVGNLTNVPKSAGNREQRKKLDNARLKESDRTTQALKLFDRHTNLMDFLRDYKLESPQFLLKYCRESIDLLEALDKIPEDDKAITRFLIEGLKAKVSFT